MDAAGEYIHTINGKGISKTHIIEQRKETWNCNKESVNICKDKYIPKLENGY